MSLITWDLKKKKNLDYVDYNSIFFNPITRTPFLYAKL